MRPGWVVAVLALLLAGCVNSGVQPAATGPDVPTPTPTSVLANATKPAGELTAATFALLGAVAKGGPVYGAGEPGIAAALDGTLYVTFPGCDEGFYIAPSLGVLPECQAGLVYKSEDDGASWTRLNKPGTGKLADDAPDANGDADIAIDRAGTVYVSNLGGGIHTQRSTDGGETWNYTGNVVPKGDSGIDRNWLVASGPGHVIHSWMGGNEKHPRAVSIRATFDGGDSWTDATYLGRNIGWQGSAQFAPDGMTAYVPYTLPEGDFGLLGASSYKLVVGRSLDGGITWTEHETNVSVRRALTSLHFSGMVLAPSLAVTGDGSVAYVYAEEERSAADALIVGTVVKLVASTDGGATWGEPIVISKTPNAIFPWVSGGASDRLAVTYFADPLPGDPDRTGVWDLHAAMLDLANGTLVDTLVDEGVHLGGICGSGGSCILTGGDRALLDYFENAVMPDGRLAIVYPADPLTGGKYIEIRVALQEGGSLMLEPRAS